MAGKAGTYRLSHRFRLGPGGGLAAARAAPLAPPADPVMTQASPADAVMTAAAAHYAAGRLDAAAEACEALLARRPDHFDARHLLGVARHATGRLDEARAHLLRASELAPENARARYHLGNACLALERFAEAEAAFRCALARDPDLLEARNNLGNALRRQGREMAALDCYRAVLARRPDFAPALYNMGLALAALGEFDAAIDCYRTVLARPPGPGEAARYADVQEALSTALVETGRHELAVEACRRWRGLAPDAWRAEWNEALSLLALGRYAGGWPLYERRWELPEARAARGGDGPPPVPTLAGLEGKRVLVRWEQGRGDVIQFARYLPLLARHAASVTVRVYPELQALLGRMPGVAAAIDDSAPEPAHDVAVALISLPLVFGTTVETVPAQVPYLAAAPGAAARWRARLAAAAANPAAPRIGLCWWGSPHSRRSSIPLPALEPVLALPGFAFHALQKEIDPSHRDWLARHARLAEHSAALVDFDATAALIEALDLVVTIDTSIAHLAGALGRPTWLMLRASPDWRWLRDRTDSPWYPTMRLFRQGPDRTWEPVVAAVAAALVAAFRPPPGGEDGRAGDQAAVTPPSTTRPAPFM